MLNSLRENINSKYLLLINLLWAIELIYLFKFIFLGVTADKYTVEIIVILILSFVGILITPLFLKKKFRTVSWLLILLILVLGHYAFPFSFVGSYQFNIVIVGSFCLLNIYNEKDDTLGEIWPIGFVKIYLVFTYVNSVIIRLVGNEWVSGQVFKSILLDPFANAISITPLQLLEINPLFLQVTSLLVLLTEMSSILLFVKYKKGVLYKGAFLSLVGLHISLLLFTYIYMWQILSIFVLFAIYTLEGERESCLD